MQVMPVMAALVGSGEGAAQLARFNVSKDALYSTRTRQKGTGLPSKHALPALVLATLPVKLPARELMHRPVSSFTPTPSAQAQTKAVKIKLAGLPLPSQELRIPNMPYPVREAFAAANLLRPFQLLSHV